MSAHEGGSMYECLTPHIDHPLTVQGFSRTTRVGVNLVCEQCGRAIMFWQPEIGAWADDAVWWGKYPWVGPVVLFSALAFTGLLLWRLW